MSLSLFITLIDRNVQEVSRFTLFFVCVIRQRVVNCPNELNVIRPIVFVGDIHPFTLALLFIYFIYTFLF